MEIMLLLSFCYYYHMCLSFATDIIDIFSSWSEKHFLKRFHFKLVQMFNLDKSWPWQKDNIMVL